MNITSDMRKEIETLSCVICAEGKTFDIELCRRIMNMLKEDHFSLQLHKDIFNAIKFFVDDGKVPAEAAIITKLLDEGCSEDNEAMLSAKVHEISWEMSQAAWECSLPLLIETYRRRKVTEANFKEQQMLEEGETIEDIRQYRADLLSELDRESGENLSSTAGELFGEIIEEQDKILAGTIDSGLSTGLTDFDRMLGGMHKAEVTILMGPTGGGKTALAHNILDHVSIELGKPSLLFSYEMNKRMVMRRMMAARCRIDTQHFRTGWDESDMSLVTRFGKPIMDAKNLHIIDNVDLNVDDIRRISKEYKDKYGIELVVIDYLQKIPTNEARKHETRQREVARISDSIQKMCMQLNIPVLCLAQHNKEGNAREAQDIAFDAKCVLKIAYPDKDIDPSREGGSALRLLGIEKNNNGPRGLFRVTFLKKFVRFENCYLEEQQ